MPNLRMSLQATASARCLGHLKGGTVASLVMGMSVPPIEEKAFFFYLGLFHFKGTYLFHVNNRKS